MEAPFIGRKIELQRLEKLFKKSAASLVVVMGRRRIGKSRLIQEFARGHKFYQFSALPPVTGTTNQSQLEVFAKQLGSQIGYPGLSASDWTDLFKILSDQTKTGRVIILLDEISWMGSRDPDFLGKIKNAWDLHLKRNPKLILVLCGSVSSWIDTNILSSTGFLGRVSLTLTIEELSLPECNLFWKNAQVSAYEKFKMLSVTGGVPQYLEEIKPSLSAEENIRDLCFLKGGFFVKEFNNIFSDLFSRRSQTYKSIVEVLSQGAMTIKQITARLGITQSGFISSYLEDLVKSGFISRDYTWNIQTGGISRESLFRLSDNYVRFYLKYMDKELERIESNQFRFKSLVSLSGWESMMALQFENLVLHNRGFIMEQLRISSDEVISNNPYFQKKTKTHAGCQIDYLIQTKYRTLYVCEVKFSQDPIEKEVITQVQNKIDRLLAPERFTRRPVLIHVNGVSPSVAESDYFADIIDFKKILEMPHRSS